MWQRIAKLMNKNNPKQQKHLRAFLFIFLQCCGMDSLAHGASPTRVVCTVLSLFVKGGKGRTACAYFWKLQGLCLLAGCVCCVRTEWTVETWNWKTEFLRSKKNALTRVFFTAVRVRSTTTFIIFRVTETSRKTSFGVFRCSPTRKARF